MVAFVTVFFFFFENAQVKLMWSHQHSNRGTELPLKKVKSQIILLMKKNGFNVNIFCYHININYDKS